MIRRSLLQVTVLVATVAMSSHSAAAGIPVIDGTNLIQSTMTALQTLRIEMEQVKANLTAAQQLQTQLKMVQAAGSGDVSAALSLASTQSTALRNLATASQATYGSVSQFRGYVDNLNYTYQTTATQGNFTQWLQGRQALADAGDVRAKAMMQQGETLINQLSTDMAARQSALVQAQSAVGQLQATQATSRQLDLLAAQQSDLKLLLASAHQERQVEKLEDLAERRAKAQIAIDQEAQRRAAEAQFRSRQHAAPNF